MKYKDESRLARVVPPLSALMVIAGQLVATAACAQGIDAAKNYPSKPIRIVVPFTPGGSNDILGRFVGQKLTERLGQQTVIDNRAGGDGITGTDYVARATPDGYTLLVVSTTFAMNPAIRAVPFDPLKSFTAISLIGSGPNLLATMPALNANSVKDLIAMAKSKPGQLRYAGTGGFNQFGGELFKLITGTDMLHVSYKGSAPAILDVLSGNVEVIFNALMPLLPHVRSGRLKALGVGGARRAAVLPEVPTIAEAGAPGYDGSVWWGIIGPSKMPNALVMRLNSEIGSILRDPEAAKRLAAEAAEPIIVSPDAFRTLIANDIAKWAKVAKTAGIKAE